MLSAIYILIGFVIGIAAMIFFCRHRYSVIGLWRINDSDPEKDIFNIEFTKSPELVYRKHWITFQVVYDKNTPLNGGEQK